LEARQRGRRWRGRSSALPVIGVLSAQSAELEYKDVTVPVLQGLKETGYIQGQNVVVEHRYAENKLDRLPTLAADLVRRRVAAIVASGTPAALAAKAATTTIPVVFATGGDPVALGLVASLNRPGGNLTNLAVELASKQLQLLRELVPGAAVFGVLADPAFTTTQFTITDLQAVARTLGLQLIVVYGRTDTDFETAFATFHNSALVGSWSALPASTPGARSNSAHLRPAIRCPRSSHFVNSPWLADCWSHITARPTKVGPNGAKRDWRAFLQGLKETGYVGGQNVVLPAQI
jgi:hypothetical protein